MDIASGLSAASTAINIAKDLRDIDRSVDEATFKLKIAELTKALADTEIALSEARTELSEKQVEINELEAALRALTSGENCPVCGEGHLKTERVVPHPRFGKQGIQEKHLSCQNPECAHSEKRMHDPAGLLDK
ncbi:hypothetical protein [Sediminimonas sp.]|uniref:hypothetical protein n=1 Tax=Sediminimonas sp. TaxID=2823379 RepID=UPI0025E04609|nr:hypothetical protein [Sediminimonas sp.]